MMKRLLLIFTITFNLIAYCQEGNGFKSFARDEFRNGNFLGAINFLNKAIEKESSSINLRALYSDRAFVKLKLKDYSGAIADFTKKEFYGGSLENVELISKAEAKNELKDYRGAIQDYDHYLKRNSFNIDITAVGSSFFDLSKVEQEEKKVNIKKRYSSIYFQRGNAKFNLGDLLGAKEDYDMAINMNLDFTNAYYNRGLVKIGMNQKNSACLDFSRAGELGHNEAYNTINKFCNN